MRPRPPAWLGLLPQRLRASFWFTPGLIVVLSMAAAAALITLDGWETWELAEWSPRLFGASADGSRAMLSAIATSMVTVAGVVFSITIVTLSLTATQYSPRVLRNFMRDRPTQVCLGVFLGIFAYCLMVLRTVRGGEEGDAFIPSVAVLGGMGYALAGVAVLIFFIHHVAQSIQAAMIVERIAGDTRSAIDHLFPQELGHPPEHPGEHEPLPTAWVPVRARHSGYVTHVSGQALIEWAVDHARIVCLTAAVGEFVAEGAILLQVEGTDMLREEDEKALLEWVHLGRQRTVEQDAGFGLQQLVDVALRAMSPSLNDPTTASMCIDRLGALLARLSSREMPHSHRVQDGRLRVIAPAPDFDSMVHLSFVPILHHSRGDVQVLMRVVSAVRVVLGAAQASSRRASVTGLLRDVRRELQAVRPAGRASQALREVWELEASVRHAGVAEPRS